MLTFSTTILEATNAFYTFEIVDALGISIDRSLLDTLILTSYDLRTETILNSREAQNVLETNNVTLTTVAGPPLVTTVAWELQPADTAIVDATLRLEWHVLLFRWTWATGARSGAHQALYGVENLRFVP